MDESRLGPSAALAVACERRFRQNVKALARVAPHLADLARDTTLVVTSLSASRDGPVSCRLETADGDRVWVGGNVVPQWATAQMLGTLDLPEFGHLLLAPFDGGYGLNALLAATHEHQHLFVLESDIELFLGTLMVTDVREALTSGRVWLFVGPDLGEQVADFLQAHPWHPVPKHLITMSTRQEVVDLYRAEVDLAQRRAAAHRGVRDEPQSEVA